MSPSSRQTSAVTFATNNGDIGGGEVMLLAEAKAAAERGISVQVVAPSQPSTLKEAALQSGFRVIDIAATARIDYMRGLRAWWRTEGAGLLWCNGLVPAAATSGMGSRVVHLHQLPRSTSQRALFRMASLGAKRLVVPSEWMASQLPGATVLPNWVSPVEVRRAPSLATDMVRVGFLGRPSISKGVGVLAQALVHLNRTSAARFRLVLGGESRFVRDDERDALERGLAPLGDAVERLGWISPQDFFGQIDVAVFPSIFPESFGLVVAEAQSAKVPFVVTDVGALPEVAGPGYPWIAGAGDSLSLAEKIEQACTGPVGEVVERSFVRWRERYSPEAGATRFGALLDEILEAEAER